jgi:hypothetical protein
VNKKVAIKLSEKAAEVAKNFSSQERRFNSNNESFVVNRIVSLGDDLAMVVFDKSSGKKAVALFLYVRGMDYWSYLFPTASHFLGMEKAKNIYLSVEEENYGKNFESGSLSEFV